MPRKRQLRAPKRPAVTSTGMFEVVPLHVRVADFVLQKNAFFSSLLVLLRESAADADYLQR